ncbi:hypothetical protein [Utexia brackfieldae]|uniref:hypothetical protein n=1 Tax=Utexia brackfieldae TaxID=3074108 RepID=UPI00370D08D6
MANHILTIFCVLVIVAAITETLLMIFLPSIETLTPIQQIIGNSGSIYGDNSMQALQMAISRMSVSQQQELLSVMFGYFIQVFMVLLINSLITTTITLALIWQISNSQQFSVNSLVLKALSLLKPIVFFFLWSIPYFIILSLLILLAMPIAPIIIMIGALFFVAIYTLFLGYVISEKPTKTTTAIRTCWHILKKQYLLILPMLGLWIIISLLINYILTSFILQSNIVINIIESLIGLLINFFLIAYFYRLWQLIQVPVDDAGD